MATAAIAGDITGGLSCAEELPQIRSLLMFDNTELEAHMVMRREIDFKGALRLARCSPHLLRRSGM